MSNRMKKPAAYFVVVAAGAAACALAFAQPEKMDPTKGAPPTHPPAHDHGMSPEQMAAMNPGPVHKKLAKLAGDWTVTTKMEMSGAPAEESTGTATIKMALDGRFLHEEGAGQMHGQQVKSHKMWGYNNGSKKYEGAWTYTMSTGFLFMKGESKDDGKTVEWNAWYDDAAGAKQEFKCTHTFAGDDRFTVKMHGGKMPDGTPGPIMTSTYTRKK